MLHLFICHLAVALEMGDAELGCVWFQITCWGTARPRLPSTTWTGLSPISAMTGWWRIRWWPGDWANLLIASMPRILQTPFKIQVRGQTEVPNSQNFLQWYLSVPKPTQPFTYNILLVTDTTWVRQRSILRFPGHPVQCMAPQVSYFTIASQSPQLGTGEINFVTGTTGRTS